MTSLRFTPLKLLHGRAPVLGFRIEEIAGALPDHQITRSPDHQILPLAYCTDVSGIPPETWRELRGLNTLVLDLLRFRNSHPAFAGTFSLSPSTPETLVMRWQNENQWARLEVDLIQMQALITCGQPCSLRLPSLAESAEQRRWQAAPAEEQL